jgi:hypothetical protein
MAEEAPSGRSVLNLGDSSGGLKRTNDTWCRRIKCHTSVEVPLDGVTTVDTSEDESRRRKGNSREVK